uniref:Uncharacterized protein n=1 Tax=Malurus cyaneus samueli TaxID=2593467 RepID=A0A8C5U3T3_9PASS
RGWEHGAEHWLDLLLCHPGITDQGWICSCAILGPWFGLDLLLSPLGSLVWAGSAPVPPWEPWFGLDLLLCHPGITDQGWICSWLDLLLCHPGILVGLDLLLCHPGITDQGWICSCAILGSLTRAGSAPVSSWDH